MRRFRHAVALLTLLTLAVVPVAFAQDSPNDGRYMIEFHNFNGAAAAVRAAGGSPIHEFPAMRVVAALLSEQALRGLENNPNVKLVAPEQRRYPLATWNDSLVSGETTPYGIQMVQANVAPFTDITGAITNRTVCIIDSGYYIDHEDLPSANVSGYNGNLAWNQDGSGHGTHVSGTIVGIGGNAKGVVGVVPKGIKLFIVRVFGDDGVWAYESDLIDALKRCRDGGANVVSMSLGGGKPIGPWEQNAFDSAYSAGVLSIAAAGNAGNTSISYPAGHESVVSVAAVDANEVVADFSQKNSTVEIAAPGVSVLSTVPYVESNTLSISSGPTYSGGHIDNSPRTSGVTGGLVDGGICDTVGAWSGKVVLCQRGTISFKQKLDNVKAGGGVAGVIYNNVSGGFLGTCNDGSGTTCTIPGISLSDTDGAAALTYAGSSSTVTSTITQPASGYEYYNGTSMATPHVSAVAGLVWSYNTGLSNQQIRDALNATALDRGATGRDTSYGYGIVQAKAAFCYLNPSHTACGGGGTTNNPPSADFTFTTSDLTASFTDKSTDSDGTVVSWSWAFGDGATSTAQNPSHTYAAAGTYTVSLTVKDDDGATSATTSKSVSVTSGSTGGITLSATGYKVKGVQHADLTWSGATSTSVDVFRNGSKITTTANDGAHTDNIGIKGGGSYTYKVCEASTTTCSNEVSVTF
ncbi:MAG TPA: S8 family serine peptidase [Thermoanaerobaculia bacterium]|nr:S8 family serine peptidase [Thermoanaerobaculia bacterium]